VPNHAHNRGLSLALLLGLALLGCLAYGNTIDGRFVWDDASSILLHQHVKDPASALRLFTEDQHAFAGGQGNFYRPLVSLSFMLDYAAALIGRPWPDPASVPESLSTVPFHLTNIFWHVAAAVFLALFIGRVHAPRAVQIFVPAVFVLHPLHTEAVAYISGRADMMSAAFVFAGLYAATWNQTRKQFIAATLLGTLCYVLALLSKEAALIYPALLALYLFILAPRTPTLPHHAPPQRYLPILSALVVLGVYAVLRATLLNFGSDSTPPESTFAGRIVDTFQSLALYLKLLFVPTGLHMERSLDGVPKSLAAVGAAAFFLMLAAIVWARVRRHNRIAFAFAWFLVTWLPISGIFPLNAPMAEHWMYLPMAGFFWGLAEFLWLALPHGLSRRSVAARRFGLALIALWCLALLLLTAHRNQDWHDNRSLFTATLRENPDSVRVHFNLAVTYDDLLDNPAGARRHYEAVATHYRERKENNPDLANSYWDDELEANLALGDHFREIHQYNEALPYYGHVLQAPPNSENRLVIALAALGAGRSFLLLGNEDRGRTLMRRATELEPGLAPEVQWTLSNRAPLAQFEAPSQPLVLDPQ